jgi:hypothetical protein
MNITEMINRLQEIKEMNGELELFYSCNERVNTVSPCDVICISKGNSHKYSDGVYFYIPNEGWLC